MARGPIKNTCPDINKQQRAIEEMIASIESGSATMNEIVCMLKNDIDFLEEMRSSNETLRAWGAEQEDLVSQKEEEINTLEKANEDFIQSQ